MTDTTTEAVTETVTEAVPALSPARAARKAAQGHAREVTRLLSGRTGLDADAKRDRLNRAYAQALALVREIESALDAL
jgi:hypothetical protein